MQGVRLDGGEVIQAAKVVSTVDVNKTFQQLTGSEWLDPEFVEKADQIRSNALVSIIQLGLDRIPQFSGIQPTAEAHTGRMVIADSLDYIERAFDAAKYGEIPEKPVLYVTPPTILDPSMAPTGNHVMRVWVPYTPYSLREGVWEDQKEALGDRVVSILDSYAPGRKGSVLHRVVDTAPDMERKYGLKNGCIYHADLTLDLLLYMRPVPGWFKYDTPIDSLYLCGAGLHPGGAVTGLPGKCAAQRMLQSA